MTKVTFDITMSLDGFVTGPEPGPDQPLGAGGDRLHEWAYRLKSWREPHGREGGADDADSELLERAMASAGAIVMGRGMFGGGPGPWGDEPWEGWWGDEPPFDAPVFVLTHHPRDPLVKQGTTFHFVTDGIESALDQARSAAGNKNVALAGGASVAQQYLAAGLLDELTIHVAPILLGSGVRLFDDLGPDLPQLEIVEAHHSPHVSHLSYRVVK